MSLAITQLVASYEEAGMTVEQIAEVDGLEIAAVKAVLYAKSAKYRESVGRPGLPSAKSDNTATDLTETDEELANNVFRQLAESADNDSVRLKAAMRIKDERRKRLDPRAGFQNIINNTTILTLNDHFAKAAAGLAAKVLPSKQQTITDI